MRRIYRLRLREEERLLDPRLRLGLDRCTEGRVAEREERPKLGLDEERGADRIVDPNVEDLARLEGCTLRRLTEGDERLLERLLPNRGVDCLDRELERDGVLKIRGPVEKEESRFPRLWGRCPRDLPPDPLSGRTTLGVDGVAGVCLIEPERVPALDRPGERSAPARFGLTLITLVPTAALPRCPSPPLKILGEVLPRVPALDVEAPEKPDRTEGVDAPD